MARFAALLSPLVALCLLLTPIPLIADPPATSDTIANAIALRQAMQKARYCLQHGNDSQKAVELLEAELPRVSGNSGRCCSHASRSSCRTFGERSAASVHNNTSAAHR